jgi:hypothetical protein
MNGKRGRHPPSAGDSLQPAPCLGSSGVDAAQLVQLDKAGVGNPDQRVAQSFSWR